MRSTAVKRYAAALYSLARERGLTEEISTQLEKMTGFWQDSPEFQQFLLSPRIKLSRKRAVLEEVGAKLGFAQPLANTFSLLLEKGRIGIVPMLSKEFSALEDFDAGRVRARCVVPHPLSELQLQQLRDKLAQLSGAKDVLISLEIDPSLLAGFVVSVDGKIIDGSLKGRLRRLQRNLAR